MVQVLFGRRTEVYSYGRNRFVQTYGVEVNRLDGEIQLNPISSRGNASEAVRLVIPADAVDRVCAALIAALRSPTQAG